MESVAVFGAATPCVSSLHSSPTARRSNGSTTSLSSHSHKLQLRTQHLSAFHNPSSLFSRSPSHLSSPKLRSKNTNKPHIFLPHLVASLEEVEETYIMVKPDGVQRGLVGEIISRFEKKGFKLTGLKLFQCPKELAEEHYKDLKAKPFYPKLTEYIISGPVVCMAWEGVGVVASARKLIGVTNPLQAEPGTIRGDLAVQTGRNVIHGSDSPENGKREIGMGHRVQRNGKGVASGTPCNPLQIPPMVPSLQPKSHTRWTESMDWAMLNFLTEEVTKYGKSSDNGFKMEQYRMASVHVGSTVGMFVSAENVKSRMKTLKVQYLAVKAAIDASDFGIKYNGATKSLSAELDA